MAEERLSQSGGREAARRSPGRGWFDRDKDVNSNCRLIPSDDGCIDAVQLKVFLCDPGGVFELITKPFKQFI